MDVSVSEISVSSIRVERRFKIRYPVRLQARYRSLNPEDGISGVGLTVNMSSSGLLVTCQHHVPTGSQIEVLMEWPSLLDSTVPLQLVTSGRVVRSEHSSFVIEFARYQFRTMRSKPLPRTAVLVQTA